MRAPVRLLTLALVLPLSGCETLFGPRSDAPDPLTALPRALTVSEREVIGASNRFAFDLLREVSRRDTASNVVLSPLSASMALGMTLNGARGETFDGMRAALGFGALEPEQINASYRSLIDLLLGLDRSVDMRLANSIWVRQGFPLHDAFVQSSRQHFDAEVTALDFSDPGAPATINAWVDRGTGGRIPDIVESIPSDVVMYLINAVYFKGVWTEQFNSRRTHDATFHRADGGQQQVRMMHRSGARVRHLQTPEVEIVDLPYGRDAFSMTLLLPAPGRSLDEVVASLDAQTWDAWMDQLAERELDVFLPRFRLDYEQVLNEMLKALGMEVAFDPYAADFGGMSPLGHDLFITNVKQKTFLEVNEKGTEAAAATSVEVGLVSLPPSFRADRPFLLAIRERFSGTLLFLGTIGAPPAE